MLARKIVRVWFDKTGAAQEPPKPWLVEYSNGDVERLEELTVQGIYEGRFNPVGEKSLIGSPKAYLELKLDETWKNDSA